MGQTEISARDRWRSSHQCAPPLKWDPAQDARPWVQFCLRAHYIQAASVLRRVRESETIWNELGSLVESARLQERSILALFDAALGFKVRNSSYRASLKYAEEKISIQVATSDLKGMVNAGLLLQNGRKRGTFYIASPRVAEIRARLVAERAPLDPDSVFRRAA